jgi:hypothetical protein
LARQTPSHDKVHKWGAVDYYLLGWRGEERHFLACFFFKPPRVRDGVRRFPSRIMDRRHDFDPGGGRTD